MIGNYIKLAWRNLLKHKSFSAINILGLTMGLSCCILLALYVRHELSFDKFHSKGERIVRVIMDYSFGDASNGGNYTSTKVFPEFRKQFPEVVDGVRLSTAQKRLIKYNEKVFDEDNGLFADSTFFNVFDFALLQGNAANALVAPNSVVLTKTLAEKLFGNENAIGKTVQVGSRQDTYNVTGVVMDAPSNSQLQFRMLLSFSSLGPAQQETYFNANYVTYLLLDQHANLPELQAKVNRFMESETNGKGFEINFTLEPFETIHLYSSYDAYVPNGDIRYVYIVAAVALLILVIACFTYINLSTARSAERAREVGVRKATGALRGQLFWQFIIESLLITFLSVLLSIVVVALALPLFNSLSGVSLSLTQLLTPFNIAIGTICVIAIAMLAGSYPALLLTKFRPVSVLKSGFKMAPGGNMLRNGLIVFQYGIAIFLIICTFIIKGQLHYIQQKKLGFDRQNILVFDMDSRMMGSVDFIKNEIESIPGISGVSFAYDSPLEIRGGYGMSGSDLSKTMAVTANPIDENYTKVLGLELIAGQPLTRQHILQAALPPDSGLYFHFILNESAAKALGWNAEEAIGKKMYLDEQRPGEVQAVVKDFHFASLQKAIEPVVLFPGGWYSQAFVKVDAGKIESSLDAMETKWKSFAAHRPFDIHFLEDDFQKMYESEMRIGRVFNAFAYLAIFLACLGLFGLSAYAARQRIKEIGVRKVLGASVTQVVVMLSSGFIRLVLLSFAVAAPFGWMAMNKWLQQFEYRTALSWWVFVAVAAIAVLLALFTVSFQAIKAALANPVKSLRTE